VERLPLNDLNLGPDVPWIDHHHSKKGKSLHCMSYHVSSIEGAGSCCFSWEEKMKTKEMRYLVESSGFRVYTLQLNAQLRLGFPSAPLSG